MTREELFSAIDRFLNRRLYYACLLVVHPEIAPLEEVSRQILVQYGWPSLSVGTVVSQALLPLSAKQRPRQAKQTFTGATKIHAPGPLLCTDIDLLFEPSLALDPLRLLREASRQTSLVVTWPGSFMAGVLAYATHAHAHYQTWPRTELDDDCIVAL